MLKRIALISAPLVTLGLVGSLSMTGAGAASPSTAATSPAVTPAALAAPAVTARSAKSSSFKIKAKNSKRSDLTVILHGTDDKKGVASSVNAPAMLVAPGSKGKGRLNGNNCAVWIPARTKLIFSYPLDFSSAAHTKKNTTNRGYDWVFAKGGSCRDSGLFYWQFKLTYI